MTAARRMCRRHPEARLNIGRAYTERRCVSLLLYELRTSLEGTIVLNPLRLCDGTY